MTFDGLMISYLISELSDKVIDAKLVKITMNQDGFFIFTFLKMHSKTNVVLSVNAPFVGFYETKKDYPNTESNMFLKTLKKTLEQAKLVNIYQIGTDRIVELHFQGYDFIKGTLAFTLVFELMGRHANLILIQNNIIIDAYKKHVSKEGRSIMPKLLFTHFETSKKPFTFIDYETVINADDIIANYQGISKKLAQYLITHKIQIQDIKMSPVLYDDSFYPFPINPDKTPLTQAQSLSMLMDEFKIYAKPISVQYEKFLKQIYKKTIQKLHHLENDLEKAHANLDSKNIADDIYLNQEHLTSITASYQYHDTRIVFDDKDTLNNHAQKLYKKYHKAKRSIDPIHNQINETRELLDYIEYHQNILPSLSKDDLADLEDSLKVLGFKKASQHKQKKHVPHILTIICENTTIYVGKNQVQNEFIVTQLAHKDDYWFHTKDYPGSHVVVRTTHLSSEIIEIASMLAMHFSNATNLISANVNYTKVKNVKRVGKIAKFKVIINHFQTVHIKKDNDLIRKYIQNN